MHVQTYFANKSPCLSISPNHKLQSPPNYFPPQQLLSFSISWMDPFYPIYIPLLPPARTLMTNQHANDAHCIQAEHVSGRYRTPRQIHPGMTHSFCIYITV